MTHDSGATLICCDAAGFEPHTALFKIGLFCRMVLPDGLRRNSICRWSFFIL